MVNVIENTKCKVSSFGSGGHFGQEELVILIEGYCSPLSSSKCGSLASASSGWEWYASQEHSTFGSIHIILKCGQQRSDVMSAVIVVKRVEACTKQSPHGCIADDGTVGVKMGCRPGVIEVVIGSKRGSKLSKVLKGHVGSSVIRHVRKNNPNKRVVITSQGQRKWGQRE